MKFRSSSMDGCFPDASVLFKSFSLDKRLIAFSCCCLSLHDTAFNVEVNRLSSGLSSKNLSKLRLSLWLLSVSIGVAGGVDSSEGVGSSAKRRVDSQKSS